MKFATQTFSGKLKLKSIKKALKIVGITIGAIIMIFLIFLFALRFSPFQTFLTKKAAAYLSDQLNTTVSLKRIDVEFFKTIVLEEFFIEDQDHDTLIYADKLYANFKLLQIKKQVIDLNEIALEGGVFNLKTWADHKGSNYDFIADYFSPPQVDTVIVDTLNHETWKINFDDVRLVNSRFIYEDIGYPFVEYGVDFSHLDVTNVNGIFRSIYFKKDTIFSEIEALSFNEKSGFGVLQLFGNAKIHSTLLEVKDLKLETKNSNIKAHLIFSMDSFLSYNDFNEAVEINTDFDESLVAFEDIAFFAPELKDLKEKVFLTGKVTGTVSNMKGRNVEMHLLSDTYLKGSFDLRGLPIIDETFIYLKVSELRTSKSSLERMPLFPFSSGRHLEVPENFELLGTINFKGSFTGFVTDFVAYGEFNTALGQMVTDISLKSNQAIPQYTGKVKMNRFNAGRFFGIEQDVQKTTLIANVTGEGFTKEDLNVELDGNVKSLELFGYNYKNIEVKGKLNNQRFEGIASIEDENIDFDFNGKIDVSRKLPIYNFKLNVNKANLAKLNLIETTDTSLVISTTAQLNMIGNQLDNLEGGLQLSNSFYRDSVNAFYVKNITIDAHRYTDSLRSVSLRSDVADLNMNGDFSFNDLLPSLTNFAVAYIPSAKNELIDRVNQEDFTFDLTLKNTSILSSLFFPTVQVSPLSRFNGNYNSENQLINFYGFIPTLTLGSNQLQNITVTGESPEEKLILNTTINRLVITDSTELENINLKIISANDSLQTHLTWQNDDFEEYKADLTLNTVFDGFSKSVNQFQNSYIIIKDTLWTFNSDNEIIIDTTSISISRLKVGSLIEEFSIEGNISENPQDSLIVSFDKMSLSYLENIIPASAIQLKGAISGNLLLKDLYNKPIITSNINVAEFVINENYIGNGRLKTAYDIDEKVIKSTGYFGITNQPMLKFNGSYYPNKKQDNVIITAVFSKAPLNIFEQYTTDYLSNVSGTFNGTVLLNGNISLPQLQGKLKLNEAKFKVDYLNTNYVINDEVIIEPDFFGFNLIKIFDEKGNSAIATGTAFHEAYENFSLDIGLELDNFLVLNTQLTDNDLYYGKANVSGLANISGYADNLIFEMNIKTEKNTRLNIPLSEGTEVYSSDFLTFVKKDQIYQSQQEYQVNLNGIVMNFDLTVTPEAEVRLIFDEQIGDVIKGRGNGNIKMQITTLGDFEMYGQYVIDEGDYLFTLQNLINKKFILEKGGQITWNGDPFEANMDLSAIYKLRSSLYDILPDDTSGTYKRRVPVTLQLNMEGRLMNPDIDFDIELPTADEETKQRLRSVLYVNSSEVNKQEMNKQVFSLLILNRFARPAGLNQQYEHANVGATSSSELLSNQLSNWLSRISDDVDIGVNYRPGDELSSDEYEVALSTQIFNDRVTLDGNVGYSSNNYQLTESSSGLIGEFSVEYKISKDGRFRLRGFNRSNNNSLLINNSPYTQGAGLFYREEFNNFTELVEKYKKLIFGGKKE